MSPPISDTASWQARLARNFGAVRLVRLGENALWHAPDSNLAIRLYRRAETSAQKARREIAAAAILQSADVPVIAPAHPDSIAIDGRTATLWNWCPGSDASVNYGAFGALLAQAHRAWLERGTKSWPVLDPISKIEDRLTHLSDLPERTCLKERLSAATRLWMEFSSAAPRQIIHGDAHSGNVISTPAGLVLCDFDETKIGPVEWDLVSMIVGQHRFSRPKSNLDTFAGAFGATPEILAGAKALAPVKELSALSWLAMRAEEDAAAHHELRRRLGLSREGPSATWHPL